MVNFSIISLVSLVLVYQNILLLNEETLILVCFIIFCWAAFNKLSESTFEDLIQRSKKIEDSLDGSLNEVLKELNSSIENQNKFKNLSSNFESLANHLFKLSSAITNQLPIYLSNRSETVYTKKFIFIQRLEKQTIKLLALLLIEKLNKIVLVQKFCTYELKVSNFLCFQSINFLKYINNV